jgi:hypothetical protein
LVEPAAGLPGAAAVGIGDRTAAVLDAYPRFEAPVREALTVLATPPPDERVRTSPRIPRKTANAALATDLANGAPATDLAKGAAGAGPPVDLTAALADLERERSELFTALLEVVVSAWALSEPVWEALGYEGQRDIDPAAHPIPEELFEPLLARGPRWRQPPEVTG